MLSATGFSTQSFSITTSSEPSGAGAAPNSCSSFASLSGGGNELRGRLHKDKAATCCQKTCFGFDSSRWCCWKKRLRLTRAAREEGHYLEPDARSSVLAIILGGGAGTRLHPLTKERAKPAVPLGANYRLIDIPISNCINSNIPRIYVLTQYNSTSLNSHLYKAYSGNMGGFSNNGYVEVLAAEQSQDNTDWFRNESVMEFLILAGDHLYRMDYQRFIQHHRQKKADITVATVPVSEKRATGFGLMKIDSQGQIIEFAEKPKGSALHAMQVDTTILGLDAERAAQMPYIASMGIYVIGKQAMFNLLQEKFPHSNDFGCEIIPGATQLGMKVQTYLFDGYWEDIGTIEAFYNANIGLTRTPPEFSFDNNHSPIYTLPRCLPPSVMHDAEVVQSIIGEGCVIQNCRIHHSVIGLRSRISEGAVIEDALVMGNDFYEGEDERVALESSGGIPVGVGRYSVIRKAIIDKNARIGRNVRIINKNNVLEAAKEADGYFIRNGIVTILKDAVIPNGTTI